MEILKLLSIGLALGILVVIPGLSTGTMAVVFNVYDRLIGIITPNVKKIISEWKFWLPLVIGGAVGLAFISKVIDVLYKKYPFPITWFFIGVITGSLPLLYDRMKTSLKPSLKKFRAFVPAICAVLTLAIMIIMAILKARYIQNEEIVYTQISPRLFILLVLAGVFSAIAMIIPGISGAFLLLVIGLYWTVMRSINNLNIPLLIPLAIGILAGLLAGAALVRFLLSKAPAETYGAVLGLVAGSIVVLFPGGSLEGVIVIISAVSFLAGAALSFLLGNKKK
jgi:putative membrane protein